MGDLSPHFSVAEFRCKGRGSLGHVSHPTVVSPELVQVLEAIRERAGRGPLRIISGYRCGVWNRRIGGAVNSQHLYGNAADIPAGYVDLAGARAAGARGVGTRGVWAVHVDVRGKLSHWRY